jgi:hypothetical protein
LRRHNTRVCMRMRSRIRVAFVKYPRIRCT